MIEEIKAVKAAFPNERGWEPIAADWCDDKGTLNFSILAGWLRKGKWPKMDG